MDTDILLGIGAIVVLGVGAQWLASRLKLPGILLLIPAGLLAGPVTGVLEPDRMFGDALFPAISVAVGLLLFEGGLGLRLRDLRPPARSPVLRLITLGALATWLLAGLACALLFDLPTQIDMLIGAIIVVSGPTVVGPILRLARPRDPARKILIWEGITIDPIGATLGVVMLNIALVGGLGQILQIVPTILVGVAIGLAAAALLILALRNFTVPDELEVPVALLFVVGAFVAAERLDPEAGLFATTVIGIALANQRWVPIRSFHLFGRTLGVLIIGSLFVVLGARVDLETVEAVALPTLALVGILILVIRPLIAFASTAGQKIPLPDRTFIASLAPRGIVAASTASLFAIRLQQEGSPAPELVPIVFGVIIGTCLLYGLAARPLALVLGVGQGERKTVVLVGDDPWVVELARHLCEEGVPVLLVAVGEDELAARTDLPFPVHTRGVRDLEEEPVFDSAAVAITAAASEERNQLALEVLAEAVGRQGLFHLPEAGGTVESGTRLPFGFSDRDEIDHAVREGAGFVTVDGATAPSEGLRQLLRIGSSGVVDCALMGRVRPGDRLVCLVSADVTITPARG
ncbi:MAG: cation:proton antiporter [Actinomycetota bacterium]